MRYEVWLLVSCSWIVLKTILRLDHRASSFVVVATAASFVSRQRTLLFTSACLGSVSHERNKVLNRSSWRNVQSISKDTSLCMKNKDSTDKINTQSSRGDCKDLWIVVVDDEEAIRKAIAKFLFISFPSSDTRITDVENASSVLDLLKTSQNRSNRLPDLIIADVRMPGMSGIELLDTLRSSSLWTIIPLILLTAKSHLTDRLVGYDSGADAYVTKPFDPDELLAIIKSVLARQRVSSGGDVTINDLQQELQEIKNLLKQGNIGTGATRYVEDTGVFFASDEQRILELLCQGKTNQEMADTLFLSRRRIEQLLTGMYRKTTVRNRTELVRWAVATGHVEV